MTPEEKRGAENQLKREDRLAELDAMKDVFEKYWELIMVVQNKFPDETRHQTALRYIMEREASSNNSAGKSMTQHKGE